MSACVFAKAPLASARNKMMFVLSDLRRFMANKAGVSSLDLAFVHRPERTITLAYWHAPLSYQYTVCLFFICQRKMNKSSLIRSLSNGALCHHTSRPPPPQEKQYITSGLNYRFACVYPGC